MTNLDRKTPAQRAWATAHNTNAHYDDLGPTTPRQRAVNILEHQLGYMLHLMGGRYTAGSYADLGLADQYTDLMERLEGLLLAVQAAGKEPE
jgi:hypothetical protein